MKVLQKIYTISNMLAEHSTEVKSFYVLNHLELFSDNLDTMDFIEGNDEEDLEAENENLHISQAQADYNYMMAGTEIPEPPDQISVEKYQHLMLNDKVHQNIMEVLTEANITFQLADFQMISLHVLGNQQNLILISPTGSGKMLGRYLIREATNKRNNL